MRVKIIMHLSNYDTTMDIYPAGNIPVTTGSTGLGTGAHAHFGEIETDKPFSEVTWEDFARGSGLHVQPTDTLFDNEGVGVTFGYLATDEGDNPCYYPASKPHLGEDRPFVNKNLTNTKRIITKKGDYSGSGSPFGKYMIYMELPEDSVSTAPKNVVDPNDGNFRAVRASHRTDSGTYRFEDRFINNFVLQNGVYILDRDTNDMQGNTWKQTTIFDSILNDV